tara:strand:- start:1571 stop:1744 length:174 start_codon:yes stop_codon:yes gene_type:complete
MNLHTTLEQYYKTNHQLMYWHKYSITELDSLYPWEKKVYVDLLAEEIKKENERQNNK